MSALHDSRQAGGTAQCGDSRQCGEPVWFKSGDLPDIWMLPKARQRWDSLPVLDRADLRIGFHDAVKNPRRIAEFSEGELSLDQGRTKVKYNYIHIGYCHFILIINDNGTFIHDFWLRDTERLAAE